MILGIDISNIGSGGGITHITELLKHVDSSDTRFNSVVIWGKKSLLSQLPDSKLFIKVSHPLLERGLFFRIFWQILILKKSAFEYKCNIIFFPGGINLSGFKPFVSMSQNALPFELRETFRFGFSLLTIKFLLLRIIQSYTFRNSNGIIFLTNYARKLICTKINLSELIPYIIIPHGVSSIFYRDLHYKNEPILNINSNNPLRCLYVSSIEPYKHHLNVISAFKLLNSQSLSINLSLIGPSGANLKKMQIELRSVDPLNCFIKYYGNLPYQSLPSHFFNSDIGIFASSCENMPNVLLEMMAARLPIACSKYDPMPEILQEAGVYFDPLSVVSIASAIKELYLSSHLRKYYANLASQKSNQFTWHKCSVDTFSFLYDISSLYYLNKK